MTSIPADTLARASAAYRATNDHERGIAAAAHVVWDHLEARLWVHPRPELLVKMLGVCKAAERVRDSWCDDLGDELLAEGIEATVKALDALEDPYTLDLEAEVQATLAEVATKAAESERRAVVAWLRKLDSPDEQIRVGALIMIIEQREHLK